MPSETVLLEKMRAALAHLAETLDAPVSVELWDGSRIPLGEIPPGRDYSLKITSAGVIASLIKNPSLENLTRHYACGHLPVEGGDFFDIAQSLQGVVPKDKVRKLNKSLLLRTLSPFLLAPRVNSSLDHEFGENETGLDSQKRDNKDYIQFHYDVGNDFYKLFLDPEMQYSCGYFTDFDNSLEQAQRDKLDMICKKLRLQPGDRFLDIGCGWGGLVCHAVQNYGVHAHGVTLSQEQFDFATAKVKRLGLDNKIKLEIRDYTTLDGEYDKIASIGMFEHIGLDNFPNYFRKVNSLLRPRGIYLNHGIARRAKAKEKRRGKITPEKKLLLKYIFPGSELAPIGYTVSAMETHGFEVHDVEGWREHYGVTCYHWCKRLTANKDEAIRQVGLERYNLWVAYLAAVSLGFTNGSMLIFQTVGTKRGKEKGRSQMPPTRADLYT